MCTNVCVPSVNLVPHECQLWHKSAIVMIIWYLMNTVPNEWRNASLGCYVAEWLPFQAVKKRLRSLQCDVHESGPGARKIIFFEMWTLHVVNTKGPLPGNSRRVRRVGVSGFYYFYIVFYSVLWIQIKSIYYDVRVFSQPATSASRI